MKSTKILAALAMGAAMTLGAAVPARADEPRHGVEPPPVFTTLVNASAEQLALAMDVPEESLGSADFMGSDPRGAGVEAVAVDGFPTAGPGFAVLSTGLETSATLPNDSGDLSSELGGLNNDQGQDLVRLHLRLVSPPEARCLAFDVGFLSEEFPEFVGSEFNDTFTAQLNQADLSTNGSNVVAPANFALDTQGNVLDVNTVFGVQPDTGTTYDGGTPRLRASAPVPGSTALDLYLSIQDLGDPAYDSAAFLDNFFWSSDQNCRFGSTQDTDADGLLDDWENQGLNVNIGGTNQFVDLPAMGADPQTPDVFVEIDSMVGGGHSHRPDPAAISAVIDSFAAHGVHLHVDYGPDAPLRWGPNAAGTWGALSRGNDLAHDDNIGGHGLFGLQGYTWGDFDDIKDDNFDEARESVFHYNVWAHHLAGDMGTTSGISRGGVDSGGAGDFIVSLAGWTGDDRGTVDQQTGTFMHELGHNLGLGHGGGDNRNQKPNYLSIMSYSFQMFGLPDGNPGRRWDYSTDRLFELQENNGLDEADGIHLSDPGMRTVSYACGSRDFVSVEAIDWNCDGDTTDLNVQADVNDDGDISVLDGHLDWGFLTFTGGSIGLPGSLRELPAETRTASEYTKEQYDQDNHDVVVPVVGTVTVPSGPVRSGTALATSATFSVTSGDASSVTASWTWGDGSTSDGVVSGTGVNGTVTGSHTYTQAGVYPVSLTLTASGGTATSPPTSVVVYDPKAGSLTGLGTIPVPAGAYASAPSLSGSVSIGVSAAYLLPSKPPAASLVVRWKQAGLTLTSASARWLVVSGRTATLAGTARINGAGTYEYELTAVDGKPDQFRLLVWNPALGSRTTPAAIVLDTDPSTHAPTALTKGHILIL